MILSKGLMGKNNSPIRPEEWNKLNPDEKVRRVDKFNAHVEEWNRLGVPTSLGDLVSIAIRYQVPIPTNLYKLDENLEFEGFN